MSNLVIIANEFLTVSISTMGAEIQSVKGKNGTEFMWCGDANVWSGHAPVLFPICGGLKEDKYQFKDKEYNLQKHGYLRRTEFEVESTTQKKVVMLHKSNEKTFAQYPFNYEFRAIFELKDNMIDISYKIDNKSDETMYFSVGAHEAYACPEGIEEYTVEFDKSEILNAYPLQGNLLKENCIKISEGKTLPLLYKYFDIDALVFKKLNSDVVTLIHNNSSKKITLDFTGHDYFLIWTKPQGKYICLEPWNGIGDIVGSSYDFTKKEGIMTLKENGEYIDHHTITFEE